MEQVNGVTRLLKSREVEQLRGCRRTKRWVDIGKGLLPPPIRRGERDHVWPEDEIRAIIAAEIRGDSEEQRRELVRALVAARATRTS